jgi:hypothetical protein
MLKVPFSADMGRSDYRDGSAYFSSNGHVITTYWKPVVKTCIHKLYLTIQKHSLNITYTMSTAKL